MELKGTIKVAKPTSDEQLSEIKKSFENLTGQSINFEVIVDPAIIGGFIVNIENKIYDKSVRSNLANLAKYIGESNITPDAVELEDFDTSISFDPSEIASETRKRLENFLGTDEEQVIGTVVSSSDGVVHIQGLVNCKYGELIAFENDCYGIAMNLDMQQIGAVILNNIEKLEQGTMAKLTGNVVTVPAGRELLGRVIDPLGNPLDSKGKIKTEKRRPIEAESPQIKDRQAVKQSLETGIMSIDSMIPIGKGQRELIIGDRQTGKTAIAIDTILNQKGKDVICIYVAIGQKASTIADIIQTLTEHEALSHSVVVVSTASDAASMQYIAPYSGCAIAEEFMYQGKDVLIVYDDLSKHAVAYRTMSLLLRRPPGREAYPGDVFYLHSRLLERAAKLSDDLGAGSITALPIIETMAGDISAYIPTNVISITDGQIYLESELFNAGMRPAVNVGLSVSRVGGSAQSAAMRKVAGRLRLDLAQFRELAVFAQFAGDLEKSTQESLDHGVRVTETLKQTQFSPYQVSSQVILLYTAINKYLMKIPIKFVGEFNKQFLVYIDTNHPEIRASIESTKAMSNDCARKIGKAVESFLPIFCKMYDIELPQDVIEQTLNLETKTNKQELKEEDIVSEDQEKEEDNTEEDNSEENDVKDNE